MNSIKLTPFILFLFLLIILVISSLFGKRLMMEEGFEEQIQEGMANTTSLNSVLLSTYSIDNKVWNLYDNIYFDDRNANLIEVDTVENISGNVTTSSVATIVTLRSDYSSKINVTSSGITQNIHSSTINEITPKYKSAYYPSQLNHYHVFYMPWNKDTYMHVIDNNSKTQLATFLFSPGSETKKYYYSPPMEIGLTNYVTDNNTDNNKMVIEPLYDDIKNVFQLSQYVKYDIINSNIIITKEPTKTLVVYDINKTMYTINPSNNNNEISKKPRPIVNGFSFTIVDDLGQNIVLCIPNNNNVLVALFGYSDTTKNSIILKSVCRFNEYGLDDGNQIPNNVIADYYKLFWNSTGKNNTNINNDYILKTQIVPPVCPTCPTCPSTGTCTNCGGTGGSGTLSTRGNTVVTGNTTGTNQNYSRLGSGTVDSNANPDTIGGSLTLMQYDATSTIEDVAKTGAGVVTGVAGTIGGVANNLISTTGSVLKPNQMGGIQNNGPNGPNAPNQRSTPGYTPPGVGTNNQYSDPYSYYGQLPPKGKTNYVPVTADFSRFGR